MLRHPRSIGFGDVRDRDMRPERAAAGGPAGARAHVAAAFKAMLEQSQPATKSYEEVNAATAALMKRQVRKLNGHETASRRSRRTTRKTDGRLKKFEGRIKKLEMLVPSSSSTSSSAKCRCRCGRPKRQRSRLCHATWAASATRTTRTGHTCRRTSFCAAQLSSSAVCSTEHSIGLVKSLSHRGHFSHALPFSFLRLLLHSPNTFSPLVAVPRLPRTFLLYIYSLLLLIEVQ